MDDARALATPAETARLLNADEQDNAAFVEVILDYFYDCETAHSYSEEDGFWVRIAMLMSG